MSPITASRRIWVTRTLPLAEATAERLRALGWEPVVEPVLETRPLSQAHEALLGGDGHSDADALAFTSQAAVSAYAGLRKQRNLQVFVVGEATGRAAFEAGFNWVEGPPDGEGGDVISLADRIAEAIPRPSLVLNPTAAHPAADLADLLARRGVPVRSVAVYETVETPIAAPPQGVTGLLVHSPRAALALARLILAREAAQLTAWVISEAAADPLRALGFARILVAEQPHEHALLARLAD